MLATQWWPNTNPIGPASLFPLGMVVLTILIERLSKRRAIAFVAAPTFALLAVLGGGFPFHWGRRFPDADDFVGYYICVGRPSASYVAVMRRLSGLYWLGCDARHRFSAVGRDAVFRRDSIWRAIHRWSWQFVPGPSCYSMRFKRRACRLHLAHQLRRNSHQPHS